MKKRYFLNLFKTLALVFFVVSCQEEEPVLDALSVPSNLTINITVADDQSGNVTLTASAENALNYHAIFTPNADPVVFSEGGSASFRFTQSGQYTAPITVVAFGRGGISSSSTVLVDLDVRLTISPEILAQLAGGDGVGASSKRWVWDQTVGGHFGVGPLTNFFPEFFSASANQLNPCLYDDVLVFSHDGNENYSYTLEPGPDNQVFINWTEVNRFFPEAAPQQFVDECRDITDQAVFNTNFVVIEEGDSSTLDVGSSFLSYWAVIPGQYEILELTDNRLALRGISQPFNGDDPLAWYSVFVPEGQAGGGGMDLNSNFNTLIWADEFDVNGAPDPANWAYDLGNGVDGWGNQEVQNYTDLAKNVIVEDGNLKITAKTEMGSGTYYFDEISLADDNGMAQQTVQDFEGMAPAFTSFGGGSGQVIANPDASGDNTTANVGEFVKLENAQTFAGSFFDLDTPLDLTTNDRIRVMTWSPRADVVVRLKIENSANGDEFHEVDAVTTVAGAWEPLVFDFSAAPAFNYDRVVIFFDFGLPGGTSYTSARIKTEQLQEFTYGRAEVRAKLPTGGGTWPAIWMLGGDYLTNPWPAAGEMDIMEHVGNNQDIVLASTHDPNNFGGGARTSSTLVPGASTDFHVYEMEWNATEIKFAVDGQVYHTVTNDGSLPFNKDFFFILNVAMGGTLGGDIDAAFEQSTMEIDYIRMYQ